MPMARLNAPAWSCVLEAAAEQPALFRPDIFFDENGPVIGKAGNPFPFHAVSARLAFCQEASAAR